VGVLRACPKAARHVVGTGERPWSPYALERTVCIMNHCRQQDQNPTSSWVTGLTYVGALLAGVVLISSGQATPAEASGYVAPFLVIYERMLQVRTGR
jgi:hypothetical protein